MGSYPLVVGHINGYPMSKDIPSYHAHHMPPAGSLQDSLRSAMIYAEHTFNTGWFWFLDSRYHLLDADLDKLNPLPTSPLVYAVMNESAKCDPFMQHGGLYLLPTLSTILRQEFQTWRNDQYVEEKLHLQEFFPNWPYLLVDTVATARRPAYQGFILEYDEPTSVSALTAGFLSLAHRMRTHTPIYESHKMLAGLAETQCFWVFDADFILDGSVNPWHIELWPDETNYVHLWHARNPINGLEYGHGGPKLFNRDFFLKHEKRDGPDTTLSVGKGLTVHTECMGTHAFNWSPFSTWRTAVREAAKLTWASEHDMESLTRLRVWTDDKSVDFTAKYASYCLHGAKTGEILAKTHQSVNKEWVNNYAYLSNQFNKEFPNGP